jgi:hypothetical protein
MRDAFEAAVEELESEVTDALCETVSQFVALAFVQGVARLLSRGLVWSGFANAMLDPTIISAPDRIAKETGRKFMGIEVISSGVA